MDRIQITKEIFTKKTRDYTFTVLFFLIFSAFIIFAINPSLTTAASLKKEEKDLQTVNNVYESKINEITTVQAQMEENRDQLYLLDEAVSRLPQVNKMVDDVKTTADSDSIFINKANIADVNLLENQKTMQNVKLSIEGKASFENLTSFFNDLSNQRRLKTIDKIIISRDPESTGSANLKIILYISGYYL